MNIVDVLAILPYYVELAMAKKAEQKAEMLVEPAFMSLNTTIVEEVIEEEEESDGLQGLLQVFRVFKLARILKLARLDLTKSDQIENLLSTLDILGVFSPSSSL